MKIIIEADANIATMRLQIGSKVLTETWKRNPLGAKCTNNGFEKSVKKAIKSIYEDPEDCYESEEMFNSFDDAIDLFGIMEFIQDNECFLENLFEESAQAETEDPT